ncbi:hypothetical protein MMC25_003353 [Agyrium rufum]|nr:hypothetical protein [Agyrium rufum]
MVKRKCSDEDRYNIAGNMKAWWSMGSFWDAEKRTVEQSQESKQNDQYPHTVEARNCSRSNSNISMSALGLIGSSEISPLSEPPHLPWCNGSDLPLDHEGGPKAEDPSDIPMYKDQAAEMFKKAEEEVDIKLAIAPFDTLPQEAYHPGKSREVFAQLLDKGASMEELWKFLNDRKLNHRNSQNILRLLSHYRHADVPTIKSLGENLQSHLKNNRLATHHALRIFRVAFESQLPAWRHLCRNVWKGIVASTTLRPSKITLPQRESLLRTALRSVYTFDVQEVVADLLPFITSDCSMTVKDELVAGLTLLGAKLGKGHASEEALRIQIKWFYNIVATAPEMIASETILKLTKRLMHQYQGPAGRPAWHRFCLHTWLETLTQTSLLYNSRRSSRLSRNWENFERCLFVENLDLVAKYLTMFSPHQVPSNPMHVWIKRTKILAAQRRCSRPAIDDEFGLTHFSAAFAEVESHPSHQWVIWETYAALSTKQKQGVDHIVVSALQRLNEVEQYPLIVELTRFLKDYGFKVNSTIFAEEINRHMIDRPGVAADLFLTHKGWTMEDFPSLSDALINSPQEDPKRAFGIFLRENSNLTTVRQRTPSKRRLHLTKSQSAVLHDMAMSFAQAQHLSPSQALRKVERCYRYFLDCNNMIMPQMAQALSMAGLVRPTQAGKSTGQNRLREVLEVLREFEGADTADRVDHLFYHWRSKTRNTISRKQWWESKKRWLAQEEHLEKTRKVLKRKFPISTTRVDTDSRVG